MKSGIELIAEERQRQVEKEGWTTAHDAGHVCGELAAAGAAYALWDWSRTDAKRLWPFEKKSFKPGDEGEPLYVTKKVKNLTKAAALIAAEIDRLPNIPLLKEKGVL